MTDRFDDGSDAGPDNELDRALDDAIDELLAADVPPPTDGFWDRVDASLAEVADQRPPRHEAVEDRPLRVADPSIHEVQRTEEPVRPRDTDGDVIRLTDMRDSTTPPSRSPIVLRAAAVVVLLALVGGLAYVALGGDGGGDEALDVATEATTTSTPAMTTTQVAATGDEEGSTESTDAQTSTTAATTTSTVTSTTACVAGCDQGLPIAPLTNADVLDTFGEDVGCWFRAEGSDLDEDGFDDPVFFSGDFGGLMVVDGEPLVFEAAEGAQSIGLWTVDAYTGERFDLGFVEVGDEVETSIESTDRPATLQLLVDDGGVLEVPGVLGCGV